MGYSGGNNPYSNSGLNDGGYQYGYGQGNNNPWQQGQNTGGGNSGSLWGTGLDGSSGAGGYGNGAWGAYGGSDPNSAWGSFGSGDPTGGTYGYRNQQGGWTGVYNMADPTKANGGPAGNTKPADWTWSDPSKGQYGSPTTAVTTNVPNTSVKARTKPGEPPPVVPPPVVPPPTGQQPPAFVPGKRR